MTVRRNSHTMRKWIAILIGVVLLALFVTYSLSYRRSLWSFGVQVGRFNLQLAYTNYLATGKIEPNGNAKPYLFTNVVSVGGTQYQCAVAIEMSYFQGDGFLAMTTNQQFIFLDKKRGPLMIPASGYYRARLFPPGM